MKQKKRLFVPLSTNPYNWFLSGSKEWELRKAARNFTSKQVYRGRVVELRRGYNTSDKIYGVIDQVIECKTLQEVFDKIDFKKIIPVARDKFEAINISYEILNPTDDNSFIVFKVRKKLGGGF